jgi:hypothetical protein
VVKNLSLVVGLFVFVYERNSTDLKLLDTGLGCMRSIRSILDTLNLI